MYTDFNSKALKAELPDMVDTLLSLVSSTVSLGLPRASNHLFAIGQLLADASRDRAFAAILAESCKILAPGGSEVTGCRAENAMTSLGGFVSFLAGNIVSTSSPDHVKSDLMYVALELLDCIVMAKNDAVQHENMLVSHAASSREAKTTKGIIRQWILMMSPISVGFRSK